METSTFLHESLRYGRELIDSGVAGLREGSETYLENKPAYLSESVRHCVTATLVGAAVAALPAVFSKRGTRARNGILLGIAGAALGFAAGFAWNTRDLTSNMTRSANRKISNTRDAHWLENHPVTYA